MIESNIPQSRSDFVPEQGYVPTAFPGSRDPAQPTLAQVQPEEVIPVTPPAPASGPARTPAPARFTPQAEPSAAAPSPESGFAPTQEFGPAVTPAPVGGPLPDPVPAENPKAARKAAGAGKKEAEKQKNGRKTQPSPEGSPKNAPGQKKSLLPILLIAAAVILIGAIITAFVFPGFLRSDKRGNDTEKGSSAEQADGKGGSSELSDDENGSGPAADVYGVPAELAGEVKKIDGYGSFTVGLSNSGKVFVWGQTVIGGIDLAQIPEEVRNAKIIDAAAGSDHIVAVGDDGTVYCWGCSDHGQFGPVDEADKDVLPMPEGLADGTEKLDAGSIKKLICGNQVTALLMEDGTLYLWGNKAPYNNDLTFFSDRYSTNARKPKKLTDIVFARDTIAGLDDEGDKVVSSMRGLYTKFTETLGTGEKAVKAKSFLKSHGKSTITSLAANKDCLCLVLSSGSVAFTCSDSFDAAYAPMPALEEDEQFTLIGGGSEHFAGLTNRGRVLAWGDNSHGQLNVPADLSGVHKLFVAGYKTYCMDESGKLICAFGGD